MNLAKLWLRGPDDWHARFFRISNDINEKVCGWASCSASLLSLWKLEDWPVWAQPGASLDSYRLYVKSVLSNSYLGWWSSIMLQHKAQIPYSQFACSPAASICMWRRWSLTAAALSGMRSFCRLRCGQLVSKHLNRSKSMALIQYCIFCDQRIRNATVHCLVKCRRWRHFRLDLCKAMSCRPGDSGQVFALGALRADSQPVVEIMCIWAAELDRCCYQFWQEG